MQGMTVRHFTAEAVSVIMPTEDIPVYLSSHRDAHKQWHIASLTCKHMVPGKEGST